MLQSNSPSHRIDLCNRTFKLFAKNPATRFEVGNHPDMHKCASVRPGRRTPKANGSHPAETTERPRPSTVAAHQPANRRPGQRWRWPRGAFNAHQNPHKCDVPHTSRFVGALRSGRPKTAHTALFIEALPERSHWCNRTGAPVRPGFGVNHEGAGTSPWRPRIVRRGPRTDDLCMVMR